MTYVICFVTMKGKFKQWWSSIPQISIKQNISPQIELIESENDNDD